jgi:hypothetical protein
MELHCPPSPYPMNVADEERLYEGIHRVLRTGGRLAPHEIMASSHTLSGPGRRDPGRLRAAMDGGVVENDSQ